PQQCASGESLPRMAVSALETQSENESANSQRDPHAQGGRALLMSLSLSISSLLWKCPTLLRPLTGAGRDRGAKKITPTSILPRRGEGGRNSENRASSLCSVTLVLATLFLFLSVVSLTAQDKKLDSFTISYASVSGTRGPLWIAKDLGLFEKYGLDGNLIYIASGVVAVNALLGGSVDIIAASGSSAVGAAARGAPIVIVASLGHIAYKLIAMPSIKSVHDLKGKIIGTS